LARLGRSNHLLWALAKIQATQNDTGRSAFEFHCKNLASGALFDLITQPDESRFVVAGFSSSSIAEVLTAQGICL